MPLAASMELRFTSSKSKPPALDPPFWRSMAVVWIQQPLGTVQGLGPQQHPADQLSSKEPTPGRGPGSASG
jgi:hypothetical protein